MESPGMSQSYNLKEYVEVRILIPGTRLQIKRGLISRVMHESSEIGIYFELNRRDMFDINNSKLFNALVQKWLLTFIDRFKNNRNAKLLGLARQSVFPEADETPKT